MLKDYNNKLQYKMKIMMDIVISKRLLMHYFCKAKGGVLLTASGL